MIGVSPAYFLSRCGPGFGPAEVISGLPYLAANGYASYQAEVFLESALHLWTGDAARMVAAAAQYNGLSCSAFVAHFLGGVFSSPARLSQGLPLDQTRTAIRIASAVTAGSAAEPGNDPCSTREDSRKVDRANAAPGTGHGNRVFVVPLPAFVRQEKPGGTGSGGQPGIMSEPAFRHILQTLLALCHRADLNLALELLPGNVLGGSAEFMNLNTEPGFADLGLLLDTGHFWAMGERVQDLPSMLGSRIIATHLCDNDGRTNLSLCPGDGTIPFQATLKALGMAGYTGSLDLEIVCPEDQVEAEYRRGLVQFRQLADQAMALPDTTTHPEHYQAAGCHTTQQHFKETI